ncbi:MAG: L-threonylcarbamoyladenylate synthase [Spirochaetia bacterium]
MGKGFLQRSIKTTIYTLQDIPALCTLLGQGELVAFPSETVFGLGANAYDDDACKKIYLAKGRPVDNPFIVHISSLDRIGEAAQNVPDIAMQLFERFSPGPLTIIVPRSEKISPIATAGLHSIGIRIPASPIAQKLLSDCPFPLAAPSANRSGRPSPTTTAMVYQEMQGRIPAILNGPDARVGLESTIISCLEKKVQLLRPGIIAFEELEAFLDNKGHGIHRPKWMKTVQSPGTHHPHYRPNYQITLFEESQWREIVLRYQDESIGLMMLADVELNPVFSHWKVKKFIDTEDFARQLYKALVEFELLSCVQVLIILPQKKEGITDALRDRLMRAASKE